MGFIFLRFIQNPALFGNLNFLKVNPLNFFYERLKHSHGLLYRVPQLKFETKRSSLLEQTNRRYNFKWIKAKIKLYPILGGYPVQYFPIRTNPPPPAPSLGAPGDCRAG